MTRRSVDSSAPPGSRTTPCVDLARVPALDAVRGVAILLVLSVHAGNLVPGGALGVDLFFVLSGFLITSLLLTEWRRTNEISFGAFYVRRARRLLPALALVLLTVVGVVALMDRSALRQAGLEALAGAFYVSDIVEAMTGTFRTAGLSPLWSLATEEQFYLLWPPILALLLVRKVRAQSLIAGLAIVAATLEFWRVALLATGASAERLWLAPDTHADPIVIGCLAGVAFSYGLLQRAPFVFPSLVVAVTLVATLSWLDPATFVLMPVFAAACAVIVLGCALEPRSLVIRALDQRPLRYFGRISYGLYLWHLPIFVAFGWVLGLPLSVAVAALSFRYLEQPLLRLGRRPQERTPEVHEPKPRVVTTAA